MLTLLKKAHKGTRKSQFAPHGSYVKANKQYAEGLFYCQFYPPACVFLLEPITRKTRESGMHCGLDTRHLNSMLQLQSATVGIMRRQCDVWLHLNPNPQFVFDRDLLGPCANPANFPPPRLLSAARPVSVWPPASLHLSVPCRRVCALSLYIRQKS